GGLAPPPARVGPAEAAAGAHPDPLLGQARDGQVALPPAPPVEQLRVDDVANWPVHAVGAEPLQEGAGIRTRDLELGERALVEQRGPLAAGGVLGSDGRRPDLAGPAAWAQRLVTG